MNVIYCASSSSGLKRYTQFWISWLFSVPSNVRDASTNVDAITASNVVANTASIVNAITTANVNAITTANLDANTESNVGTITASIVDAITTANVVANTAANVDAISSGDDCPDALERQVLLSYDILEALIDCHFVNYDYTNCF